MSPPGCRCAGQDFAVSVEREGSLLASFCADRGEGSEAVSRPWPSYGRARCRSMPMWRLAGRWRSPARSARRAPGRWCSGLVTGVMSGRRAAAGRSSCRRLRCGAVPGEPCAAPGVRAGLAAGCGRDGRRGDRAGGRRRVRGAPGGGPGRVSRIRPRAAGCGGSAAARGELGVAFAALAVELGGEAIRPAAEAGRFALAAVGAAFGAAAGLPGWLAAGRVAVRVVGERREADRGQHKLALPGRRQTAFHASCPIGTAMNGGTSWTTRVRNRSHCTAGR